MALPQFAIKLDKLMSHLTKGRKLSWPEHTVGQQARQWNGQPSNLQPFSNEFKCHH